MTNVITDSEAYAWMTNVNKNHDIILVNRTIARLLHTELSSAIGMHQKHERCTLVLTTLGGDPHAGYRIARCLRHHYKHVRILVPSRCKSAGTMIAIGANDLAIGDLGELGPLDIQVLKPAETIERGSGLDVSAALNQCLQHAGSVFFTFFQNSRQSLKVSPRLAGEFASQVVEGLLAPLYSQIDPLRLGELHRAMAITLQYGQRLDGHSSNLRPHALNRLVIEYPAHEFVIDRKEARELFNRVEPLSDTENYACKKLWGIVGTPSEQGPFFLLPEAQPSGDQNGTVPLSAGATEVTVAQPAAARPVAAPASAKRPRARSKDR
ncbi:MAG: hypothetical protein AB7I35_12910 [Ramlibacter sp.]